MDDLKTRVHEDLSNAAEGGYLEELQKMTPRQIAEDLVEKSDMGKATPEEVEPHVVTWLADHPEARDGEQG